MKSQTIAVFFSALFCLSLVLAACGQDDGSGPGPGSDPVYTGAMNYKVRIDPYEVGAAVGAIIVTLPEGDTVAVSDIAANKFRIQGVARRTVSDAFISDEKGNQLTSGSSRHFTVEMRVSVSTTQDAGLFDQNQAAFTARNDNTGLGMWVTNLNSYELALAEGQSLVIKGAEYTSFNFASRTYNGRISPFTDGLKKGVNTVGGQSLAWAAYETDAMKNDNKKNPLIIWLHGAGEGGTDVDIPLLGCKVTNIFQEKIQKYFIEQGGPQGAYVFVPQTPNGWMTGGWTQFLYDTIVKYVTENGDIDPKRIYIGGNSAGGYMTMYMLTSYPGYFAAGFPVCEARGDSAVNDTEIQSIKDIPIWFTHASNDTTVNPVSFTNPIFARLIREGAQNVHYTYFNKVTGDDFPRASYYGHSSWIWTLQDRCVYSFSDAVKGQIKTAADLNAAKALVTVGNCNTKVQINGKELTLWGWLAAQSR
ncbi:MAG: prolyl oligopeptidase family serine peptidase [Treponema sp.]|nr:prolyl oligopeptidase family serine peptidase [Treponema sp.]